jgi:hypothetical protein
MKPRSYQLSLRFSEGVNRLTLAPDLIAEFQERSLEKVWRGSGQVMMPGTWEEDQSAVCCHLAVEGLRFRRASQAIGSARQDQYWHIVGLNDETSS